MNNAVVVSERVMSALETVGFDRATVENWKTLYCKGASDDEAIMFMRVCKATDLSPEKRQIFCVPRWDSKLEKNVYTPQTSVDGLRSVAERSGKYEGQTEALWCGKDGVWKDLWIPSATEPFPFASKVGVYKAGCKNPIYGVARWDAYVQVYYKNNQWHTGPMWKKMGDTMLAKCAESLALRKAFPNDTHGLYTKEEMEQAENGERDVSAPHAPVNSERGKELDQRLETKTGGVKVSQTQRPETTPQPVKEAAPAQKIDAPVSGQTLDDRLAAKAANIGVQQTPATPVAAAKPEVVKEKTFDDFKKEKAVAKEKKNLKTVEPKEAVKVDEKTGEIKEPGIDAGEDFPSFDKFESEAAPAKTCWDYTAQAGIHANKTMKEIYADRGKGGMITMYEKAIEKIGIMGEQGKAVPQTVKDLVNALEACINELP